MGRRAFLFLCVLVGLVLYSAPGGGGETPPGYAVVTGRTLSVMRGIPGGLSGQPEPNWKPPEPTGAPGEKIFWLRIDWKKGHQLFSTVSDDKGEYRIELPAGRYLAEPASLHAFELRRYGEKDTRNQIKILFRPYQKGENGPMAFYGEPGMEFQAGEEYREDIDAQILFVD